MKQGQRKYKILEAIVDSYVVTGEPIGSKTLAQMLPIDVSSATIRNDMADLTSNGYLEQPHTSAGRIPSQRGYRLYVDQLMWKRNLAQEAQQHIIRSLAASGCNPEGFIQSTASMLAEQTGMAAIITSPADSSACVAGVEVMATGRHSIVLVMMITPSVMKSRICRLTFDVDNVAVALIRHLMQKHILGMKVSELTEDYMNRISAEAGEAGEALAPIYEAVTDIALEAQRVNLTVAGLTNLIDRDDLPFDEAKEVLAFLKNSEELIDLLTSTGTATTRVLIGRETKKPALSQISIIASRYYSGVGAAGWTGVIGPTRMNYASLIPHVEYFAGIVGRVMREALCIN